MSDADACAGAKVAPSAGAPEIAVLLDVLAGRVRAQAVSTAAALGLADRLDAGPKTVEALADEMEADPARLGRLLVFLAGMGFVEQDPAGTVAVTPLGRTLRADALGPLAAFLGSPEQWHPWSALRDSLRVDSPSALERTFGCGLYEALAKDPAAAARYDAAIDAFTRHSARALAERYDFSTVRRLVDVGGGRGAVLCELLAVWPELEGVLFDLPHVVAAARDALQADERLHARIDFVEGDFRHALPAGADAYLLKHVLHNWDDAVATALLARCAEAVPEHGRVLVVESILAPDSRLDLARLLDLEMLVLTNGRERRKPELRRLIRAAGLHLEDVRPLADDGSWLLVCRRRG